MAAYVNKSAAAKERLGASYKITAKRAANHHGEHTQKTQAFASQMGGQSGSDMYATDVHSHTRPPDMGVGAYVR